MFFNTLEGNIVGKKASEYMYGYEIVLYFIKMQDQTNLIYSHVYINSDLFVTLHTLLNQVLLIFFLLREKKISLSYS